MSTTGPVQSCGATGRWRASAMALMRLASLSPPTHPIGLAAIVARATIVPDPNHPSFGLEVVLEGLSLGGEPPWGNRVDAMALIRDSAGTGDLTVTVGVVDKSTAADEETACRNDKVAKCTVQTGPNGEVVLLGTEADNIAPDNPRNWVVRVYRGHSEIYVQASNTDRQVKDGKAPTVTRPTPVLTTDQTIQMALAPELYLFP